MTQPQKTSNRADFRYQYPRMLITVDAVIFLRNLSDTCTHVLLVKRGNSPYKGDYALPGGFPEMEELLHNAAQRELFEETGLRGVELHPLGVFDKINRDPRDRNIAIAFYGYTTAANSHIRAGDDAETAQWFPLESLPPLAFDHAEIVKLAREKLGI